jgi:hypothetical protein
MLYPEESDFTVTRDDAGTVVTFKPTKSAYCFHRLADPEEPLPEPWLLHRGPTGDTGEYWPDAVLRMACRLAKEALYTVSA